ncbi:HNH endonuclease [Pseudokineococcus sp. 5B2Z-1]|uniref:HNH endonuclease n=1 Tax=Pseudokineococcus sp. 5B2Z-1 TaxID=3132744 RepID=UPI0030B5DC2B
MATWSSERDAELRREAMAWLTVRSEDGREPIPSDVLREFVFEGERMPLLDAQRGIRKPAVLEAALSIRTVYTQEGRERPYDDAPGPDGMLRYKWRGDDPSHPENRALRQAWRRGVPLIWFFGVSSGMYLPVFPILILDEEVEQQQFVVDPDVGHGLVAAGSVVEETMRRYIVTQTRRRLHQPVFRATVMRAYATRCAVCSLAHGQLLDAAHIIPDAQEQGIASVRNGMAMCKIHHAAFDANILGVDPQGVVMIRKDLLDEVDGPMLTWGLQKHHGERLRVLPAVKKERPDPLLLEQRWQDFVAAS